MCDEDNDSLKNNKISVNATTKVNNEKNNNIKMVRALSAIALEMQTFSAGTPTPPTCVNIGDLSEKLSICKSNLRLKKKQIKLLKQNLRKACIVAKTVMSAKERTTMSLQNYISSTRSDCIDLYHKNITKTETIYNLKSGNLALQEKLKNLEEFIELGYQELQKIQNKCAGNLPTVMKLKEIMISCGQYYAGYTKEYDTRLQLEQRNRFLNNKIKIIVNNLEGIAEELKNVRHLNSRIQKENIALKNKILKRFESNSLETIHCTSPNSQDCKNLIDHEQAGFMAGDHASSTFDLTSHLTLVRKLLNTQDYMLNDLKMLSQKLSIEPKGATTDLSKTNT